MLNSTGTNQLVMGMTALERLGLELHALVTTIRRRSRALEFGPDPAHAFISWASRAVTCQISPLTAGRPAERSRSGCVAVANHALAWAMAGDNVEFTDMDAAPVETLR